MTPSNSCVHCGADCGPKPVIWNDQKFCCHGCEQVYRILNENKLNQYYQIDQNPGIRIETTPRSDKYAFLEREEVQSKLFEFREGDLVRIRLFIPGIHCASCIWLLENLNRLNRGIRQSVVHFVKKELTVTFDLKEISVRQLVELLVSIHYIPDISLKSLDQTKDQKSNRRLLYKIGVAGFVFGNVMLYSLPEYFNGKPLNDSLGPFLYYMSYFLTVPLVFYSGSDYLVSAFKNLRKKIINVDLPIALGLLALFGVTSWEVLTGSGPGYSDSLSGFLFFLLIGKWYQNKTYQALSFDRDYKSYFPVAVTRLNGDLEENALLSEIGEGDLLLIRNKELIPADGILEEGLALLDYSFVSGESVPVRKNIGDPVYAGGIQTAGAIKIRVIREVEQSHLTSLWNDQNHKAAEKNRLISLIDRISVWFTLTIILIALGGFSWWLIHDSIEKAVIVLTSVLIVACPCALALSLPFTLGSAMRMMGRKGFYVKNTDIIQKMTQVDTVVFDKTGTLTFADQNEVTYSGDLLEPADQEMVAAICAQSLHPLSQAVVRFLGQTRLPEVRGFVEVAGRGIYGEVSKHKIRLGSASYLEQNQDSGQQSASQVYLDIDQQKTGCFTIGNKYRQGMEPLLEDLRKAYPLYVLSGDTDAEKSKLSQWFKEEHLLFGRKPDEKMAFIDGLNKQGASVMMLGDGLNDAGAFMHSHVAVSVADDVYHFSPAGDAIVQADSFAHLPAFIRYAKAGLTVVRMSFLISFLYNAIGLSFALSGTLSPVVAAILMPLSSVSVVAFATLNMQLLAKKILK